MAKQKSRAAVVVARHLRYAWLEYEETGDAVVFDRIFRNGKLGWINLFTDLSATGKGRSDAGHKDLLIEFRPNPANPNETGLFATPQAQHQAFLEMWIRSPGANAGSSTLTSDIDATQIASFLVTSGHGAAGAVFGDLDNKLTYSRLEVSKALSQLAPPSRALPPRVFPDGKLEYLLIPACRCGGIDLGRMWHPAFINIPSLRGVLAYANGYGGGIGGANQIATFASDMHKNPDKPIIDAWLDASSSTFDPSGFLRLGAETDTMRQWVGKGLPSLGVNEIRHFNRSNRRGSRFNVTLPPFQVRWHITAKDGTLVQVTNANNGIGNTNIGLFPGTKGFLELVAPAFAGFDDKGTATIVFYRYREDHSEMDLDKLLTFNPTTSQQSRLVKKNDRNPHFSAVRNRFHAIEYTFDSTESTRAQIDFTVNANAAANYPAEPNDPTHGWFYTGLYMPGIDPRTAPEFNPADLFDRRISMYELGVCLRD